LAASILTGMPRKVIYLLLAAVVIQWGAAFVAIRILVEHASAVTVTLLRFVITSGALAIVVAVARIRLPRIEPGDRWKVVLVGLLSVSAYHLALNFGEHFVSAGVASLIVASMPVMAALLATVFLDESIDRTKAVGIGLALAGVAVLVLGGSEGEFRVDNLGGALVTAIAPLSFAVVTVTMKPLVRKYGPLPLTAMSVILGTILLTPFALPATLADLSRLTGSDWAWLAFLGVGCTAFAYVVWSYALQTLDASSVAAWVYLVPLCSLVWAALILDERVTLLAALGGMLVLGGVFLTERVSPRMAARHDEIEPDRAAA
jgi:drug/metabolite transporter (DMT)-like permease